MSKDNPYVRALAPHTDSAGNFYRAEVRKLPAAVYPGMHCDGCAFAPHEGVSRTIEQVSSCAVVDCYVDTPGYTAVFVKDTVSTEAGKLYGVPPESVTAIQRAGYKTITFFQRWGNKK